MSERSPRKRKIGQAEPQRSKKVRVNGSADLTSPGRESRDDTDEDGWTAYDEAIFRNSSLEELKLWRWTNEIFHVVPSEMLPARHDVDTSKNERIEVLGKKYDNPNWNSSFCRLFARVICCRVFQGRIDFLQYSIQQAMICRLRDEYPFDHPPEDFLSHGRNQKIIEDLSRRLHMDEAAVNVALEVLEKHLGQDDIEDSGFLENLEQVISERNREPKPRKNVTIRDPEALEAAWDRFVAEDTEPGRLKSMAEYQKEIQKSFAVKRGPTSSEPVAESTRAKKKAWMIAQRQEETTSPEESPRVPDVVVPKNPSRSIRKSVRSAPSPELDGHEDMAQDLSMEDEGQYLQESSELDSQYTRYEYEDKVKPHAAQKQTYKPTRKTSPSLRTYAKKYGKVSNNMALDGEDAHEHPLFVAKTKEKRDDSRRMSSIDESRETSTQILTQQNKSNVSLSGVTSTSGASKVSKPSTKISRPTRGYSPLPRIHEACRIRKAAQPSSNVLGPPQAQHSTSWRDSWNFEVITRTEFGPGQTATIFDLEHRPWTGPEDDFFLQTDDKGIAPQRDTWAKEFPYFNFGPGTEKFDRWYDTMPQSPWSYRTHSSESS